MTLTRDRLAYTKHCFATLHEYAGCEFDHYVLDQGSTDGTREWLLFDWEDGEDMILCPDNVGINRGMNRLLDWISDRDYDVIVKCDNDCELTQPNTLRDIAELVADDGRTLLSPRILGLNNPPLPTGSFHIGDEEIVNIPQIGGIFTAAPASLYREFRFDESRMLDDDVQLCWWWRGQGGRCGYVKRLEANHYETTSGQHARYPEYFARTLAEGKACL